MREKGKIENLTPQILISLKPKVASLKLLAELKYLTNLKRKDEKSLNLSRWQ